MNVVSLWLALAVQQPQDTVVLKPLVVSATRIATPADVVASTVTVIRGADLEARGLRTVADALRAISGAAVVESGSYGGQTALFMRGGESDYVKVLLDGVPLNQPGGAIDLAHLTIDNVDRIEIVRGPGSVVYGSDAMTGVIQIFSRNGSGASRVGAEVRAGTYGTSEGKLDAVGGGHTISYSATASRFASDGLYPYNNEYRNTLGSARVTVRPDARSAVSLGYRYGDNIYHFPTDGTGAPVDSNQRSAERGPLFSVEARRAIGSQLEAQVLGTWRESRMFFNDEPDSPGEFGSFSSRDYLRRTGASALVNWRASPPSRLSVIAGVEHEDQAQRGLSEFSGSPNPPVDVKRSNTGYFVQAILGAADPLALTFGGRLDDNSQFGSHGTYRIGFVFHPRVETRLRFSAGTGFKEPTFFENYAQGFVRGNPDLKPERSRSWEAGIDRTLMDGRVTLAATYFQQRFRDLIDFTFNAAPGEPNYFNVVGASARGLEAELAVTLSHRVAGTVKYMYLHTRADVGGADSSPDAQFVPGEPLIRRPVHAVTPQLSAAIGKRVRFSLESRWIGRRVDLDFRRPAGERRITREPFTRVDLAAQYEFGAVIVLANLQNIFDDRTEEPVGFRPRGRTVFAGVRLRRG